MGLDAPERNKGERSQTSWRGRASIPAAVPATRVPRLANPEVSDKAVRRRFTAEYKRRILQETDQCGPGGIMALMRSGLWQGAARSIAYTFLGSRFC
jgi:transposase